MKPHVSVITLAVSDLERAARFYENSLKLPRIPMSEGAGIAFFEMGSTWLSLYPRADFANEIGKAENEIPQGTANIMLAHNLESTEAVDALFKELSQAQVKITRQPEHTFWGGYAGMFSDPDEYLWEVAWNPHFPHV